MRLKVLFRLLLLFQSSIVGQIDWGRGNKGIPVLKPGQTGKFDATAVNEPCILEDGDTLRMWFTGTTGGYNPGGPIGYAISTNGIDWIRKNSGNPVLDPDYPTTRIRYLEPTVVKDRDTLRMYFHRANWSTYTFDLIYAYSLDGLTWEIGNSKKPILVPGSGKFDQIEIRSAAVLNFKDTLRMWYQGVGQQNVSGIGYAISSNGINWTKMNSGNPVFKISTGSKFDSKSIESFSILKDNDTLKLFYMGKSLSNEKAMGYAISHNGINWSRQNAGDPVFTRASSGAWDENYIDYPVVNKLGNKYRLWYYGFGSRGGMIGYAESPKPPKAVGALKSGFYNRFKVFIYPNPFNPTTTISFTSESAGIKKLSIFNSIGQIVWQHKFRVNKFVTYDLFWNSIDNAGDPVPSGIYFIKLSGGPNLITKKLVLLK